MRIQLHVRMQHQNIASEELRRRKPTNAGTGELHLPYTGKRLSAQNNTTCCVVAAISTQAGQDAWTSLCVCQNKKTS